MDRTPYLAHIRAEAETLLVAAAYDLAAPVPACPGWDVAHLVGHLGGLYRWVAGWVSSEGHTGQDAPTVERRPSDAGVVVAWARAGLDELLAALAAVSDEALSATWVEHRPGRFWPRRMAVETALHRWDVQAAVGEPEAGPEPVDAGLAVEGIDELFDVLVPERVGDGLRGEGEVLHLHATDAPGEWLVTLTDGLPVVERGHAKGDVAARGTASDLLLYLWHRVPADRLQVFGDAGLLERWRDAVQI
jgi:uncharacterized protein (TIGR03083 family)